ncbi:MAG TPA: FtsQ-type POTRA domain-containing protein, partial [Flavisolibacter sp.]|nr:FtsQ-type POTRA domain-containing protein [Flavisolibacter sp.]
MNKKRIIRKVLQLSAWVLVGCGMITLLAAANGRQQEHLCKAVIVSIKGSGEKYFVEKQDILQQLQKAYKGAMMQEPVGSFNLTRLESALMTNPWIHEAEMYFDSRDMLHVIVTEREPIARVFTTAGSSYYMDST